MERLLMQLASQACNAQAVASHPMENGMQMLAYPLKSGVLVALGYAADLSYRVQPQRVVQRRSAQMDRFGAWLPAVFADGSCYVVRRVDNYHPGSAAPALPADTLAAAQELLS